MNQTDLIQQLSTNLKPVRLQKSFAWRLTVLISSCVVIALIGVYYWFLKKAEFHIPEGRSAIEGLFLLITFMLSSILGTKAVTPTTSRPTSSKKPLLLLASWVAVLLAGFVLVYLEHKQEALIALKYNTWLCPMVILTIATPSLAVSLFYFFRGAVLYPFQVFFYSSILSLSLGAFGLSFICPWTDPLHEILWHVIPVFILIGLVTCLFDKAYKWLFS